MPRVNGDGEARPWTDEQRVHIETLERRILGEPLSFDDAQSVIEHESEYERDLRAARQKWSVTNQKSELERAIEKRVKFCRKYYGIEPDFSGVVLPPMRKGFGWLRLMPKGLMPEQVYAAYKGTGVATWKYTSSSLDDIIDWNKEERDIRKSSYAIRLRARVEADEELKNHTARRIAELKLSTITWVERLDLGLDYWVRKRKHLDVANVTLCSGSRNFDGSVPHVYFHDGRVRVLWFYPDDAHVGLRAREVVCAPAQEAA